MTSSERSEADLLEQRRSVRPADAEPEDAPDLAAEADEADALEQRSPVDDPDDADEEYPGR